MDNQCPQCCTPGDRSYMGQLGGLHWYRCLYCGWKRSSDVELAADLDESDAHTVEDDYCVEGEIWNPGEEDICLPR